MQGRLVDFWFKSLGRAYRALVARGFFIGNFGVLTGRCLTAFAGILAFSIIVGVNLQLHPNPYNGEWE